MNDFVNDFQLRYEIPSDAEMQRLISEAHYLRHQAIRDALAGVWGMLRRSITGKQPAPAARHA